MLSDVNENSRKTILKELSNPIHDGIDMRAAYVGLQKVKSGSIIQYEMMEAISSGFIEDSKTEEKSARWKKSNENEDEQRK